MTPIEERVLEALEELPTIRELLSQGPRAPRSIDGTHGPAILWPLRWGELATIERPHVQWGDRVELYLRSDATFNDVQWGWQSHRNQGIPVSRSPISLLIGRLSATVGPPDGMASGVQTAINGRPIYCPGDHRLGADLVVDLRNNEPQADGEAWVAIYPWLGREDPCM